MKINEIPTQLSSEYQSWFRLQVETGRFPSVQAGLDTIFGWFKHSVDDTGPNDEDYSWVKPFLDEADADIAAGRVIPMEQVHAEMRQRLLTPL